MSDKALSIAIMSGKGGVGKSSLSLNLGYALAMAGHSPLLMDCDLGLANLDVLLGITPEGNLQDVLEKRSAISQVLYPVDPALPGFDILPSASGVSTLMELDAPTRDALMADLEPHLARYAFVLLDLGAGIHATVQSFASMASVHLVVLTPEPTSLTDAYALIKVLSSRQGIKDFLVLINQVESPAEERAPFDRLAAACDHFLGFTPVLLGSIRHDPAMPESIRRQKPLLQFAPESKASQDILKVAQNLLRIKSASMSAFANAPILKPMKKI